MTINSMPNIKLNYLYRDASNYKLHGSIIFTNHSNVSLDVVLKKLKSALMDSEYFIPEQWIVKRLSFESILPEEDHAWHEFESIESTNEEPESNMDILKFMNSVNLVTENLRAER